MSETTFNPLDWARVLCSQLGVPFKELPEEYKSRLADRTSKREVNMIVFEWHDNRPPPVIPQAGAAELEVFRQLGAVDYTPKIQDMRRSRASNQSHATRRLEEAQSYLQAAVAIEQEINLLLGKGGIDFASIVAEITKDGWYTLDAAAMAAFNKGRQVQEWAIVFQTPAVNISYQNARASTDINLNMGSFYVRYQPHQGVIKVLKREDNIEASGYYHPHVTSAGSVCWGNAKQTYTDDMPKFTPQNSFANLRVLLGLYNADSPYASIEGFIEARARVGNDGGSSGTTSSVSGFEERVFSGGAFSREGRAYVEDSDEAHDEFLDSIRESRGYEGTDMEDDDGDEYEYNRVKVMLWRARNDNSLWYHHRTEDNGDCIMRRFDADERSLSWDWT